MALHQQQLDQLRRLRAALQLLGRQAQGAEFGLQQPHLPIPIHPIEQHQLAVLQQHRRNGHPRQAIARDAAEHHPQAEVIDHLAGVDQVEAGLFLEDAVDEVAQAAAVQGNGAVAAQAHRQGHRHIAGAGGAGQAQTGGARLDRWGRGGRRGGGPGG